MYWNFFKTPRQRWFSADGVCFVSLFFTAKYLFWENGFMVVLAEFANCNGLWFYIPEISQNSCYQKISCACKKYRTVGMLQRIFSQIKSYKSLNIMAPGAETAGYQTLPESKFFPARRNLSGISCGQTSPNTTNIFKWYPVVLRYNLCSKLYWKVMRHGIYYSKYCF